MSEKNNTASLGWGTRIAYGLGDTACNVVFGMITALLTLFYTITAVFRSLPSVWSC